MEESVTSELRERGEVTIPKKIREAFHLEPGQRLEFIPLGEGAVLVTPKRLELEEARREIRKILKESRASPQEVLAGVPESRVESFKKFYGRKTHARKRR